MSLDPVGDLFAAIAALEHAPLDTVATIEDAAVLAVKLDEARRKLADVRQEVVDFLADTIPGKVYAIEGRPEVQQVEIKTSISRTKWQHDDLFAHVVARAKDERVVDFTTGEALESEADAVVRILRECLTPSWKVTGLEAIGLKADEFCQVEYGKKAVKLVTP